MSDAGLKVTIGADLQQALKGLDDFIEKLDDSGKSSLDFSKQFQEATNRINERIDEMARKALEMGDSFKEGFGGISQETPVVIRSIDQINAAISELEDKINESVDFKQIDVLKKQLADARRELSNFKVVAGLKPIGDAFDEAGDKATRFGRKTAQSTQLARYAVLDFGHIIRDLPYALSNPALLTGPIDRTAQLFTEITQTSGGAKAALTAIKGVLVGPGGILIGIELITTAAALLFGTMGHGADKAKEKLDDYHKTLEEVSKATGDQAAKATTLVNALNSGTLNTEQRKKAIKELQDINVEYFGSLKDEKGIVEGLAQAYDGYIKRLEDIGRSKAIESQLAKLFDKKLQLELQIDPKYNAAVDPATQQQIGKLKKQLQQLGGEVDVSVIKDQNVLDALDNKTLQQRIELQKRIQALESGTNYLKDKGYLQAKKQIDFIDLQIAGLSKIQKDTGIFDIKEGAPEKIKDQAKAIDDLLSKIKKAQEELNKPNGKPIFQQLRDALEADDLNGISLLRQKIADAITEGGKIGTDRSRALAKELGFLYEEQIKRIQSPSLFSHVDFTLANPSDTLQKLESQIEKSLGKNLKLRVSTETTSDLLRFDPKQVGINLRDAIREAAKQLGDISAFTIPIRLQLEKGAISDQLDKQLGEALNPSVLLKKLAETGLPQIGDAIGEAIASGKNPIVAAGKSIFTALGSLIQDIGKYLIEYGIAKQFLDTVLTAGIALPGVVAIGLGVAAEAIGALVKNVGGSYHAFATGGIVTGPTLGLVGEAGPEVIFPLSQLNRFIQGTRGAGATDVNVRGVIAGNTIRLAVARSTKNQRLV